MTELILAPQQRSLFNQGPADTLAFGTEVANVLKRVITSQGLHTKIQGKDYVRVEGWTTMGSLLGVLPVEEWVKEHADGSFEAMVKLVRQSDGRTMGAASALCGMDERRWGGAERYARRSMAITRATGKAYRLGFSWVMSLAGYEGTPAEEVVDRTPHEPERYSGTHTQKQQLLVEMQKQGIVEPALMRSFSDHFMGHSMSALRSEVLEFKHATERKHHESERVDVSPESSDADFRETEPDGA